MKLFSIAMISMIACAQSSEPLKFEVASIHRSDPDASAGSLEFLPGGRFRAINYPVHTILSRAWRIDYAQILNMPEWVNSERYAIEAKAGDSAATEPQVRAMVIALLEDRFHMKFHRDSPETPVYVLAVDKKGSKLKEGAADKPPQIQAGASSIRAANVPIALLATVLTRMLGRPVVDETKLSGKYDFQLSFDADSTHGPDFRARDSDASTGGAPSIFTAVQEQIGLRLESAKRPIEVLVIDSIERPTEN
jgi:uncharacterized protein (TIGR03435 family)